MDLSSTSVFLILIQTLCVMIFLGCALIWREADSTFSLGPGEEDLKRFRKLINFFLLAVFVAIFIVTILAGILRTRI